MNFTQIGSTHCAPHPWISNIFALHVKWKDTGLVPHIQDFVSSLKCPWRRRFKKADIQSAKRRGWWEASFWYSKSGRCKDREYLKRVAHDSRPISIKPKQVIEWKSVKNQIFEKVRKPESPKELQNWSKEIEFQADSLHTLCYTSSTCEKFCLLCEPGKAPEQGCKLKFRHSDIGNSSSELLATKDTWKRAHRLKSWSVADPKGQIKSRIDLFSLPPGQNLWFFSMLNTEIHQNF